MHVVHEGLKIKFIEFTMKVKFALIENLRELNRNFFDIFHVALRKRNVASYKKTPL